MFYRSLLFNFFSVSFIVIFCSTFQLFSNEIEGRILNQKGEPIPSVRIAIKDLQKQTFSNSTGKFSINNIDIPLIKLSISRIGYANLDTSISLVNNEITIILNESDIITDDVVITGTRTYKHIEDVPIPTEVVSKSEIKSQGYLRLNELISQEIGIPIVEDRGRGMQIQGMDADFTLILLNGEPVAGRTGGVLNISRFSIANVSRVEVVRGPSSSLYGSNALAGVINLITEKPNKPVSLSLTGRIGSHNTYDAALDFKTVALNKKLGLSLYVNKYKTEGYSIIPNQDTKTIPDNQNWTVNSDFFYDFSPSNSLRLSYRYSPVFTNNKYNIINNGSDTIGIKDIIEDREDNLSLNYKHEFSNRYTLEAKLYGTRFRTKTNDSYELTGLPYTNYEFEQRTYRSEVISSTMFGAHQVVGGFGFDNQQVESVSIENGQQDANLFFVFLQDDFQLSDNISLIGSLRADSHSDYPFNINPKIAASWKPISGFIARAAIGNGFKAPDFEELYLDWSLASEGYTVYGIKNFRRGYAHLKETGQITQELIKIDDVPELVPEKSLAFNLGFDYNYDDYGSIRINAFRNNINNLIEFLPVAFKTNNKRVFTYINIQEIFTQGIELRFLFNPGSIFGSLHDLSFEINYQYLENYDVKVIDSIKAGKLWGRDLNNRDFRVTMSDYGGLFNRSMHSGAVRINYDNQDLKIYSSLRGTFKSRYGFQDINGNQVLDDDREYAQGYSLWNFTLSKELINYFNVQFGILNIFDYTNSKTRMITSGRTFYLSLNFNYIID